MQERNAKPLGWGASTPVVLCIEAKSEVSAARRTVCVCVCGQTLCAFIVARRGDGGLVEGPGVGWRRSPEFVRVVFVVDHVDDQTGLCCVTCSSANRLRILSKIGFRTSTILSSCLLLFHG